MKKPLLFLVSILAMICLMIPSQAQKAGLTLTLNPTINSTVTNIINNSYYNITGGSGGGLSGGGFYLYNDTASIYLNETRLNATIDSRVTGLSETDPFWTANITACGPTQKLYFSGTSLACAGDIDTDTWAGNQSSYSTTAAANLLYVNYTGYNKANWDNAVLYANNNTFYLRSNPYSYYNATTIPAYLTAETNWNANYTLVYMKDNPYNFYNSTTIPAYYLQNNPYSFYNSTTIPAYYSQTNPYSYYNATTIPAYLTAETNWNANYTLVYMKNNPYSFYNSTTIPSLYPYSNPYNYYNATNPPPGGSDTWAGNFTSYYNISQGNSTYLKFSDWVNCTGGQFVDALGSCASPQGSGNVSGAGNIGNFAIWEASGYIGENATSYYTSGQVDTLDTGTNNSIVAWATAMNTSMKGYCDGITTAANSSMKGYVDGKETAINNSATQYCSQLDTATNTSMKGYVDGRDTAVNTSATGYASQLDTATNTTMAAYVNGKIFADAQVNDAITINGAVYVNTTAGMQTTDIYVGGATGWRIYVNGTGYLIAQDV